MYLVEVFRHCDNHGWRAYDARDFTFGNWNEIGLWLDYYGYNGSDYRVEIRFVD